jgi:hypothetical protein
MAVRTSEVSARWPRRSDSRERRATAGISVYLHLKAIRLPLDVPDIVVVISDSRQQDSHRKPFDIGNHSGQDGLDRRAAGSIRTPRNSRNFDHDRTLTATGAASCPVSAVIAVGGGVVGLGLLVVADLEADVLALEGGIEGGDLFAGAAGEGGGDGEAGGGFGGCRRKAYSWGHWRGWWRDHCRGRGPVESGSRPVTDVNRTTDQ